MGVATCQIAQLNGSRKEGLPVLLAVSPVHLLSSAWTVSEHGYNTLVTSHSKITWLTENRCTGQISRRLLQGVLTTESNTD